MDRWRERNRRIPATSHVLHRTSAKMPFHEEGTLDAKAAGEIGYSTLKRSVVLEADRMWTACPSNGIVSSPLGTAICIDPAGMTE